MEKIIAAAIQATPVFLDRDATVEKACKLVEEAGNEDARLIVFPETFIPTYPDWVWREEAWSDTFGALYARLLENAVEIPGPVTDQLGKTAKQAKAYVSVGVN